MISSSLYFKSSLSIPYLLIHQNGDINRPYLTQNSLVQMMNENILDCLVTLSIYDKDENGEAQILDTLLKFKKIRSLGFLDTSFKIWKSNISNCPKRLLNYIFY